MKDIGLYDMALLMHSVMKPQQAETVTSPLDLDQLIVRYLQALGASNSLEAMLQVTSLDDFYLPVEVVKATYDKLIALGCKDDGLLHKYASWLYLNGPDWDDEADRIMESLKRKPHSTQE